MLELLQFEKKIQAIIKFPVIVQRKSNILFSYNLCAVTYWSAENNYNHDKSAFFLFLKDHANICLFSSVIMEEHEMLAIIKWY